MSPASSFWVAFSSAWRCRSNRDCSTRRAAARFWIWLFSFCMDTTMPVGMWVRRTAESVVLTDCPPGPDDRKTSTLISFSGMSMWSVPSIRGTTSTAANDVWRRPWLSNGEMDQPVRAGLDGQGPERVRHLDLEGRGLDARLLRVRGVQHGRGVAVPLGPPQVHPQQHLGEVGRVDAACAGPDGHDGLAVVVLTGKEGADLEAAQVAAERDELGLGIDQGGGVLRVGLVGVHGHPDQGVEVVE